MALNKNTFQGNLSVKTLVVFKLNDSFTAPIEPIADLVTGLGGNRVTLDIITGESFTQTYNITSNTLQDFSFIDSNIYRAPRLISVTGMLSGFVASSRAVSALSKVLAGAQAIQALNRDTTPRKARDDLTRLQNLQKLADERLPVAIYTPRFGFPLCAIQSLSSDWSPDVGRNTRVTITFKELRIASPLTGEFIPDFDSQIPGNNEEVDGGLQTPEVAGLPDNVLGTGVFGNSPIQIPV